MQKSDGLVQRAVDDLSDRSCSDDTIHLSKVFRKTRQKYGESHSDVLAGEAEKILREI